jgi:4a-hydroxytetrahydrobiopterin dehydratase
MSASTEEKKSAGRCSACEGETKQLTSKEIHSKLHALKGWHIKPDGLRIRKQWEMKNFMAGIDFFNRVARVAEQEGHHPDLHLEGFRHATIELWTHSIGGLTENDFILASKIDELPVEEKK